jgi:ABC-2 type transport system permease protein
MIIGVPILQLLLFGFAINSDPRHLPTAVVMADPGPSFARAYVAAMANSALRSRSSAAWTSAKPAACVDQGRGAVRRDVSAGISPRPGARQAAHAAGGADATDPMAASGAISVLNQLGVRVFAPDLPGLQRTPIPPVDLRVHRRYNPEGLTAYNIVPGLMGVILTMTMVLMTGLAMTPRARARHLREPAFHPGHGHRGDDRQDRALHPDRADPGHADPAGGALDLRRAHARQPAAALRRGAALHLRQPSRWASPFSSLARNQLQAMQMTFFFFLPSILLSGFMFPFLGMPGWAQAVGNILPLTHFLVLVRGILLKGNGIEMLWPHTWPILLFTAAVLALGLKTFRRTLD